MNNNSRLILIIGAVSSLAVTATAVVCGRAEGQSGWRPINAISHIAWGRKAAQKNLLTARYTGMGLLLNGVACGFWAWLYRHCRRSMRYPDSFLLIRRERSRHFGTSLCHGLLCRASALHARL